MSERRIRITAGSVAAEARLNDSRSGKAIWDALPLRATVATWGDEIYFDIGLALAPEAPQSVVGLGDLGYWPPGRALCIFFGPTPASRGDEIRPASPVNVVGALVGDPKAFAKVRAGTAIRLERGNSEGRAR